MSILSSVYTPVTTWQPYKVDPNNAHQPLLHVHVNCVQSDTPVEWGNLCMPECMLNCIKAMKPMCSVSMHA